MNMTRRSVVSMLGLAPVGAVGAEEMLVTPAKPEIQIGMDAKPELIANALRKLAAAIDAKSIDLESLDLSCKLAPDEIIRHNLSISFVYMPEADLS